MQDSSFQKRRQSHEAEANHQFGHASKLGKTKMEVDADEAGTLPDVSTEHMGSEDEDGSFHRPHADGNDEGETSSRRCRCGLELPSRMTVCQKCWFRDTTTIVSLGRLGRPGNFFRRTPSAKNHVLLQCALMRGPSRPEDPDGCGLSITADGMVDGIKTGGMAYRWAEFRVGDQICTISGQAYRNGTPLSEYLVEGKHAYLCTTRRAINSWMRHSTSRFASEEEAERAFQTSGDFLQGTKGASRLF